jgi:hypothetical protein
VATDPEEVEMVPEGAAMARGVVMEAAGEAMETAVTAMVEATATTTGAISRHRKSQR